MKCRKCGSENLVLIKKGSQVGLYCKDCFAWQKWISKKDLVVAEKIYGYME